ncbi:hypothetical protein Cs7R123_31930 [Catellatospora sp. TT07R-123]|uniref:DUF3800 domain-containing protein n=1 Tax=Catellatospora sp. TT07R-123 TaxID=2733863 RepID=UPI001B0BD57B|nr:DUF3800 domain-containing protein [Catellatospora sp. TT07R-123]GHJ45851.1 hypothetical protein Cs7R123_31930 [Catellatospora sp. TT07R-123]
MPTTCNFDIFYIDDSGSEAAGCITFSWIQINPADWASAMQKWLAFRAEAYRRHGISASQRLHATDLAGGRRNRSAAALRGNRQQGMALIREGLEAIAGLPGARLGTAYRMTSSRGRAYETDKQDLYEHVVRALDAQLQARDSFGAIVMDGDGTNGAYARAHRTLGEHGRRLIEDPFFRHADVSQWVQIADLIAWTGYRSLTVTNRRRAAMTWYANILGDLDVHGGPVIL